MTQFKTTKIAPEGRNKYGNYTSIQNLSKKVTFSTYEGNLSTESIYVPKEPETGVTVTIVGKRPDPPIMKTGTQAFDGNQLQTETLTGGTKIVAYSALEEIPTFIGDVAASGYTDYAISGIPSGMSVEVVNNGVTGTTLNVYLTSAITADTGTLLIPCSIAKNGEEGMEDDWDAWHLLYEGGSLFTEILEWNWSISNNGESRPGATVRGPINWYSIDSDRRFCNGEGPLSTDEKWIDILLRDNVYYVCTTSYNATIDDLWETVSANWTQADEDYNFVATQLLLAKNAKIDFLTGNAVRLQDLSGNTSAGIQGGSGSTVAFWAGAETPAGAPFQVNHNGAITATTGVFAGYIQNKYTQLSNLATGVTVVQGVGNMYYEAGQQANIAVDADSLPGFVYLNSRYLKLPSANENLNGFTYKIMVPRFIGSLTVSAILLDNQGMVPDPASETIFDMSKAYSTGVTTNTYQAHLFNITYGYYEFTVVPIDGGYSWMLVDYTGEYTSSLRIA